MHIACNISPSPTVTYYISKVTFPTLAMNYEKKHPKMVAVGQSESDAYG